MTSLERIKALILVLTAECNLRCSYCYQNAKKPQSMTWDVLRASLDLALDSRRGNMGVYFTGGEPLLKFPMLRRAVEYVDENRSVDEQVTFGITTNGTLLSKEISSFLESHLFDVQLSFDGVAEAQDSRGSGTFTILDRLLDGLRREQPDFYRWNIMICVTVSPSAIAHLFSSVEYFLEKGAQKISIAPTLTSDPAWRTECIEELDDQFGRIFERSLQHWRETGSVPVMTFRNSGGIPCSREGWLMCGIPGGDTLTVDVDGRAYGCAMLVDSYQELDSGPLSRRLDSMRMGNIDDPTFAERHGSFPEAVRRAEMFHGKENKYSAYGRCGECKFLADCSVCPASVFHIPGNSDPNRVSDFCCAFNLVSLKYHERFPHQPSPWELLRGPAGIEAQMRRWKAIAGAVKSNGPRA